MKSFTVMLDIVTFVNGVSDPWDSEEFHCHAGNCDVFLLKEFLPVRFLIKISSEESHFNISVTVMGKMTMSADHSFGRERRAEAESNRGPSAYHPDALPLGQTSSQKISGSQLVKLDL